MLTAALGALIFFISAALYTIVKIERERARDRRDRARIIRRLNEP
jgi:hypothetical protein